MTRREFFKGMLGLPLLALVPVKSSQAKSPVHLGAISTNISHCDLVVHGPLTLTNGSHVSNCRITASEIKVQSSTISYCAFDMGSVSSADKVIVEI
jgi:hypothetical protein